MTQPPEWGPPPPQWGPPHRGPSRRTVWLVVAGMGVLIAVIVVVVGVQQPSQPAPGQPAPSGRSAPSGQVAPPSGSHSPAYQDGYEFGNQHLGTGQHAFGNSGECQLDAQAQDVARRDMTDWVQGCVDGVRAAQSSATPAQTPTPTIHHGGPDGTVDCSKPENATNGHCF
jgi:hypothetical protein